MLSTCGTLRGVGMTRKAEELNESLKSLTKCLGDVRTGAGDREVAAVERRLNHMASKISEVADAMASGQVTAEERRMIQANADQAKNALARAAIRLDIDNDSKARQAANILAENSRLLGEFSKILK